MADIADIAQDRIEAELAAHLANRPRQQGQGRAFCATCDEPIPMARRRALPHATLCVDCQALTERRGH